MKQTTKKQLGGRRAFLGNLTALGTLGAGAAVAQSPAPAVAPSAEADALAAVVKARFGQYLTPPEMEEVKRGIERNLRNAEAISKIKIGNSDEPDFMFHPQGSL